MKFLAHLSHPERCRKLIKHHDLAQQNRIDAPAHFALSFAAKPIATTAWNVPFS